MDHLKEEMRRLRKELKRLKEHNQSNRHQFIKDRERLASIVNELKKRFGNGHKKRQTGTRNGLPASRTAFRGLLCDLEQNMSRMINRFDRDARSSHQEPDYRLIQVENVRESVAGFLSAFRQNRPEHCGKCRQQNILSRHQIADRIRERSKKDMSKQNREDLTSSASGIRESVLKDQADYPEITADETAPEWGTVSEPAPDLIPGLENESDKDDLSRISGIGPGRHKQLNSAGIHTFFQLTAIGPDSLYEILDRKVGRALIRLWIEEAKELNS